jgi:hypothetical protein
LMTMTREVFDLPSLLALPMEALRKMDIARMNLICAQGLPGAEDLDVNRSLTGLNEMAGRVRNRNRTALLAFPTESGRV